MAPKAWFRPPGAVLRRIGPLARGKAPTGAAPQPVPVPVVAVGSLSLGGTGKTPAVIALAQRLAARGPAPHVVTRGPGAPLRVDEREHRVADVGDEALLVAAFAPTWVAHDPIDGLRAAARAGAEVVVLDGGYPDPVAVGQVTIVVEDAVRGFGNGFAWPLGPLKRRLDDGLSGADLVLAVGPPGAQAGFSETWGTRLPCPLVGAGLEPLETGMDWSGLAVIAFAGIEAPERFFASLRNLGARLVRAQALSDHQEMTPALLARLETDARRAGAQLVTTEKDAVRLPRDFRTRVVSLPVRLEPTDWGPIDALLS